MSWLDGWRHRLRVFFHRDQFSRDAEEEFAFHQSLERDQQRGGEGDTTGRIRRRFGNGTYFLEETRRMAGLAWWDTVGQDLRFALRSFLRTPGFTAVVILTLAVGIGANVAIFSAVDALLLKPLPFPQPERLVKLSLTSPPQGDDPGSQDNDWSYPKFVVARDQQTLFTSIALHNPTQYTLVLDGDAERDDAEVVGAEYFRILGVAAALGRTFSVEEDREPGHAHVVVITDGLWRRRFNADPAALGKALSIDGNPFTVIGVLPAGFKGLTGRAEFFTPVMSYYPDGLEQAWNHLFGVIGQLKPGVSQLQGAAQVTDLGRQIDRTYPVPDDPNLHWGATAVALDTVRVDPVLRRALLVLLGAVGVLLLIACSNVANLMLVRATGRRREISLRLSLGASRSRVLRQLLTESLFLGAAGGLAGVGVAWVTLRGLVAAAPHLGVRPDQGGLGVIDFTAVHLDGRALVFAAAVALGTGVLFGLMPALHGSRGALSDALKEGAVHTGGGARRMTASRNVLVIAEIALALLLLAGSGLMLRSLARLLVVDPGVDPTNVLTVRVTPGTRMGRDSLPAFFDDISREIGAIPGVRSVALADCPPLNGGCNGTTIGLRDRPAAAPGTEPSVGVHWISPGWLPTVGQSLLRGRNLDRHDDLASHKVVLVNRSAAERFWPGQDPIGKGVSVGQGGFWNDTALVVGVVADARYANLHTQPVPDVYLPYYQSPRPRLMIFVRTATSPLALAPAVRQALKRIAPDFPVYDVQTMSARMGAASASARLSTMLLSAFGLVALGLATVGAYGVIAYSVAQRRQEIGIRMALGATRGDVLALVLRKGVALAALGTAVGLVAALASTRVLQSLLYETTPTDGPTLAVIAIVLVAAVLLASWIPARRAATIDPNRALQG